MATLLTILLTICQGTWIYAQLVKQSPLPAFEKGMLLQLTVRRGMTIREVHALLGHPREFDIEGDSMDEYYPNYKLSIGYTDKTVVEWWIVKERYTSYGP